MKVIYKQIRGPIFTWLILWIGFFNIVQATEMTLTSGVKGIWIHPNEREDTSFTWRAQWIWLDEGTSSDVMLARRFFELTERPEKALLRISASSKYQLYINGEYICSGPARCAPHHQSYDILNISDLLREGENLIAVRVHHQHRKFSYHHQGRAGLLAQLDMIFKNDQISLYSDANWKAQLDPSWDSNAPSINRFQQVVSDRVDMRKYLAGWSDLSYDDSDWNHARPLIRNVGWPAPQPNANPQTLTPPWTSLVPRDIPYLMETKLQAANLIQTMKFTISVVQQLDEGLKMDPIKMDHYRDQILIENFSKYLGSSDAWVIPNSDKEGIMFLLFDFGVVVNGTPLLKIKGQPGTKIDILCAPFEIDQHFTHQVVDSDFRDRIILSGRLDQWEATYFKPTRFMGILIHQAAKPVHLYFAGVRKLEYPFEETGMIKSNDVPWVKQYMEASAKTIKVCTTDGYTDNYRERRQYAQTGYYAAMGNYWLFGDCALQRRYLIQVAQEQEANGIMPAYAPAASDDYMIILDSNCLWIRSLYNYFLYSGDEITVRELLPAAKKLIELLHSYTNQFGMIDDPPYAYWMDHALNDRRGTNFTLNGHYLGALEDFTQVLNWIGDKTSETYQQRADLLRWSLREKLWDDEKELFADALIDGNRSNMFSEHANAMALAMHVASPRQAEKIASQLLKEDEHNYIKRGSGVVMVTPAMSYFLHKGLCEAGYTDESLRLFRLRFDKMLESETNDTLWEEWWLDGTGRTGILQKGRSRCDAQTESAFPPALFAEYLLGIEPIAPGMKEILISRRMTELRQIEGKVPTPFGKLTVNWDLNMKKGGELELYVPNGVLVKLNLISFNFSDGFSIIVDGNQFKVNLEDAPIIQLSAGTHRVKF